MGNVQQFERELRSRIDALHENVECLELKLNSAQQSADSRVGQVESQVGICSDQAVTITRLEEKTLSLENMTIRCTQDVKDLATEVWHELEEERQQYCDNLSDLSSRLDDAVSDLSSRISIQEDEVSNIAHWYTGTSDWKVNLA